MDDYIASFLQYVQVERGYTPNTLSAYRSDLRQFKAYVEEADLQTWQALTPELLEQFVAMLQGRDYKSATVARKVASARSFLNFLFAEGMIEQKLVDRLQQPKVGRRLPQTLSYEEVERLLSVAAQDSTPLALRDLALLELLYATGLRASEAVSLMLDDLDLQNQTVRCMGKGNKERVIPLYPAARDSLSHYLNEGRLFLLRDKSESCVFLNQNGQPLTRQGLWFLINQYAEAAELGDWVTPHTLRHTFATHLLNGGAELREVQQFLGHANISTTQIYTEVSNRRKREAYDQAHPRALGVEYEG